MPQAENVLAWLSPQSEFSVGLCELIENLRNAVFSVPHLQNPIVIFEESSLFSPF
jgi:hypothetical protein